MATIQKQPGKPDENSKIVSIKLKILVVFIVAFGIVIGIWIQIYNYFYDNMRNNIEKVFTDVTENQAAYLDTWIDFNFRQLKLIAESDDMKSMVQVRQRKTLKHITEKYPWIYLAFTTDTQGNNISRSDNEPLKDYTDRKYVHDLKGRNEYSWQRVIGKTSNKPALILAVPILNNSERVGVLAVAMTLKEISDYVSNWSSKKTGAIFLVDHEDYILAHRDPKYTTQLTKFEYQLTSIGDDPLSRFYNFVDESNVKYISKVKNTVFDWKLIVVQSEKEVFEEISKVRNLMMLGLAVVVFVILPLVYLFMKNLSNKIVALAGIAESLSDGDFDIKNDIKGNDEIGLLANSMRRLQRSLKLAKDMLEK